MQAQKSRLFFVQEASCAIYRQVCFTEMILHAKRLQRRRKPESAVGREVKTSCQVAGSGPGWCKLRHMIFFFPTAVVSLTKRQKGKCIANGGFFRSHPKLLCLCEAETGCIKRTFTTDKGNSGLRIHLKFLTLCFILCLSRLYLLRRRASHSPTATPTPRPTSRLRCRRFAAAISGSGRL